MRELFAALFLLSLPLPPSWTVVVNGQALRHRAVLVRGQTYLPLDALRALGVSVTFTGKEIRLRNAGPTLHHAVPRPEEANALSPSRTSLPAQAPVPTQQAEPRPLGRATSSNRSSLSRGVIRLIEPGGESPANPDGVPHRLHPVGRESWGGQHTPS